MAISFTADERKALTRRQINIQLENEGYAVAADSLTVEQAKLLQVDSANAVFYNFYRVQTDAYETEARQILGKIAAAYTDGTISPFVAGDLSSSAKTPGGTLFFSASPIYQYLIPEVVSAVNGYSNPTGTDARYEQNILTNTTIPTGLLQNLDFILNGFTDGVGDENATGSIPPGPIVSEVLNIPSTTDFAVGNKVVLTDGTNSGLYFITAIVPATSIAVTSIFPSGPGILFPNVKNYMPGFTNSERQSMTSSMYQELLNNSTANVSALILEWEGKIDTQITQLGLQNDSRATQMAQNAAALSDVNNTKSIIDTWQALPNTGVGAKYTDAGLAPIQAEIIARQSFSTSREAQIVVALGNVTQSGNTYGGTANSSYFNRYKWLNIRINKSSGSARRYFAAADGAGFLTTLAADNNAVKSEYDSYFITRKITFIDTTPIVQLSTNQGFVAGDTVTVLSETQPEIQRAVLEIMGTTQIKLSSPIPNTYQVGDIARIFKAL